MVTDTLPDADPDRDLVVACAFTTYFKLINLAEERKRVRALRKQAQAGTPDDGFEKLADRLATVDPETAQQVLNGVFIQPTFTVHPTEERRKTVQAKLRSIASDLETLDEQLLTDQEQAQVKRNVRGRSRDSGRPQIR